MHKTISKGARYQGLHLSLPGRGSHLGLLGLSLLLSAGCVSTLGYIPEYPKPAEDFHWWSGANFTKEITLQDVHAWATTVMDGYDSRATMNRQADYGAALLTGLGASSLVGLTALGGDRAWITGIPIGTAFLAGVFGIYANEAKAEIYALAANQVQRLLTNSDHRRLLVETEDTKTIAATCKNLEAEHSVLAAELAEYTARQQRENGKAQSLVHRTNAANTDPTQSAQEKAATRAAADAAEQLERLRAALKRVELRQAGLDTLEQALRAKRPDPCPSQPSTGQPPCPLVKPDDQREAICLRTDIMDVMERVDRLLIALTPSEVPQTLSTVGEKIGKKQGDWVKIPTVERAKEDLIALQSPIVSQCGAVLPQSSPAD